MHVECVGIIPHLSVLEQNFDKNFYSLSARCVIFVACSLYKF